MIFFFFIWWVNKILLFKKERKKENKEISSNLAIDGQGFLKAKTPVASVSVITFPVVGSMITGSMPKNGSVAEPI